MKKIVVLFIFLFLLVGCETNDKKQSLGSVSTAIKKIDCNTAKEYANKKDMFLIDVRAKEEYESYHIKNAINIPLDEIEKIKNDRNINKNSTIIVYCRSGVRSASAASKLKEMGYTNIYDLGAISSCN